MVGAAAAVEAAVARTARQAPTLPVVLGLEEAPLTEPAWWGRRVSEPVRFVDVTRRLAELDVGLCLEIGPSPQLLGFLRRGTGGRAAVGVCRRDREWETLLEAVGEAWVRGVRVDLPAVTEPGRRIGLPTTPFERRRHWVDEAPVVAAAPVAAVAAAPKGVAALIQTEAERLLGLASGQLDLKRPLAWQGFDSIMAADLKVAIDRAFGVVVPTDAVVSGPSVAELTAVVEGLRKPNP
jgi:acyl transferase domain-containing protein